MGFHLGLCVPWQLSYRGKHVWLHSLHFQQPPSFQPLWSIRIKLRIKTFFLEWNAQSVACHSNAISVITCSEFGKSVPDPKYVILSPQSIRMSQECQHFRAYLSHSKTGQKFLRRFLFGKCVVFNLTRAQRQFSSLSLISFPSLLLHHLSQAFISMSFLRPSLVWEGRVSPREIILPLVV